MVKQGAIILINLNPTKGHEQEGCRPCLIVSNNTFNEKAKLAIVCPISNTKHKFPLHLPLDDRCTTTGSVLCEHLRTLDVEEREFKFVEYIPSDLLEEVLDIISAQIEII